jgi:hypothetical protein
LTNEERLALAPKVQWMCPHPDRESWFSLFVTNDTEGSWEVLMEHDSTFATTRGTYDLSSQGRLPRLVNGMVAF